MRVEWDRDYGVGEPQDGPVEVGYGTPAGEGRWNRKTRMLTCREGEWGPGRRGGGDPETSSGETWEVRQDDGRSRVTEGGLGPPPTDTLAYICRPTTRGSSEITVGGVRVVPEGRGPKVSSGDVCEGRGEDA